VPIRASATWCAWWFSIACIFIKPVHGLGICPCLCVKQGFIAQHPPLRAVTCLVPLPVFPALLSPPGHEKYFRTTAYGLTGHLPDYACLIVGANMGVVGMCKEHLGVALALKVPVFFVVTKVDIAPEHVLKNTVQVSTAQHSMAQHSHQAPC